MQITRTGGFVREDFADVCGRIVGLDCSAVAFASRGCAYVRVITRLSPIRLVDCHGQSRVHLYCHPSDTASSPFPSSFVSSRGAHPPRAKLSPNDEDFYFQSYCLRALRPAISGSEAQQDESQQ